MLVLTLDGHDTDTDNTKFLLEWIASTIEKFKKERTLEPFSFNIYGYDKDPRALYQIPEVRVLCKKIYSEVPSIFLFLRQETIQWFFFTVADIEVIQVKQKEPTGPVADYYSKLNPEEQEDFRKHYPSAFHKAEIRLPDNINSLIQELFANGMLALQNLASSQKEFDQFGHEFTERLKQGLPKFG